MGHTLTITSCNDPNNPHVYHNVADIRCSRGEVSIQHVGDTGRSIIHVNPDDIIDFNGIQSQYY